MLIYDAAANANERTEAAASAQQQQQHVTKYYDVQRTASQVWEPLDSESKRASERER